MSAALPIIIDCDPGLDDAVALLLALAAPDRLELLGVSVVAGNAPLPQCADNALRICALAGRDDVPVYAGCQRPLLKTLHTAPEVHGDSGIGRARLPAARTALRQQHAVDFIIDAVGDRRGVTLCPIGPLTNIALAFIKAPQIVERVERIVLMGGAMLRGNVSAAAEFNIFVDPHAAAVVFDSGVPITMFGLDVTHQVLVTPARLDAIAQLGGATAALVVEMIDSLPRRELERFGGRPLHDPCVIAQLLRPQLFAGRPCRVDVIADSGPAQGQTVVDWWGDAGRPANAHVIHRADDDGFFELLNQRLARL